MEKLEGKTTAASLRSTSLFIQRWKIHEMHYRVSADMERKEARERVCLVTAPKTSISLVRHPCLNMTAVVLRVGK